MTVKSHKTSNNSHQEQEQEQEQQVPENVLDSVSTGIPQRPRHHDRSACHLHRLHKPSEHLLGFNIIFKTHPISEMSLSEQPLPDLVKLYAYEAQLKAKPGVEEYIN